MSGRVAVIACGALAHEILAVRELNGFEHVELRCLPAILHNHPDRIPERLERAIEEARADGIRHVLVGYADCGTGGGIAQIAARHGATMLPGAHCYAFFDGVERFAERDEIDAFYITDFLARHFEAFVVKPLKLRRHPELKEMMFAHYRRVVHLEQVADTETRAAAESASSFLGLPLERRQTGYGELETNLSLFAAERTG